MDPFRRSLEESAREEPERYLRNVGYDPTDHSSQAIARTWLAIDAMSDKRFRSALEIVTATGESYGTVAAALRQRDGYGLLDPATEAGLARTVAWAYQQAPSSPLGLVVAGPTAPARGVRIKPVRPFGVEPGARPEQRHGKLWRVFLVSHYGPLTNGVHAFGWEAPIAGRIRAAEIDTEESALAQERVQAIVDPLGYVLDFVAATVRTFERHQPPRTPRLGLLISMGRRDQEVVINGMHQDHRGESLASHGGWETATRVACGKLVPVVEVAHREHEEQLQPDLAYRTTNGELKEPESFVGWAKEHAIDSNESEYLPTTEGLVPCAMLRGELIDRRSRRPIGRLIFVAPTDAPVRLLAIPNQLDEHGRATILPTLSEEELEAVERVISAWAAENNYTGSCRRRSWYGWDWFSSSANHVDALELAWRRGAFVRFWNIDFTPDGPVGV